MSKRIAPPTIDKTIGNCSICPRRETTLIRVRHDEALAGPHIWFGFCLPCGRRIGKAAR